MSFYEFWSMLSACVSWFLNSKLFVPIVVVIIILLIVIFSRNRRKTKFLSISDINAFSITIKVNMKNIDIAYMMYVQLKTRKIGIEFEENDVITEVYDSWYSAFKVIRELLLSVRPTPNNKDLIDIGMKILNEGMRPHLTRWQSKYRKWYEGEASREEYNNLSPQEIQRKYSEYELLVNDMRNSQREILEFLKELEQIFT